MKGARSVSRGAWVRKVLGPRKSFTQKNMERVIARRRREGWITAAPADGPTYEKVAFVRRSHAVAALIRACGAGDRWVELETLSRLLGVPACTPIGAILLAKLGLAMLRRDEARVELRPADPAEARFVNESRCCPQIRGYSARRVIEAVLHLRDPRREVAS